MPATNVSLAIGYRVAGQEYWDNNSTRNYHLEIVSSSPPKDFNPTVQQPSTHRSIVRDQQFKRQIARDYHAVANTSQQPDTLCGLKNLGGTCYMNSIVQSLFLTSPLTDYVLEEMDRRPSSSSMSAETMANEYSNLVHLLNSGQYCVLTASPFKQILGHLNNMYLENQQQDAHEFLLLLLDYLHTDLSRMRLTNEDDKVRYGSMEQIKTDSIIEDLFHGTFKSTTTCLECMQSSSSLESFACLSLPIPSTEQCTLKDCLAHFNVEEYLTDDSKWFCSKCEQLCPTKRRVEIQKLPKVLVIHLKRFELNFELKWVKSDALVLYPEEGLDLQECCSPERTSDIRYTLYSVINHSGSLHDGHYTTFARNLSSKQSSWFECDDEKIHRVNDERLELNSKAYLLFYTVRETPK